MRFRLAILLVVALACAALAGCDSTDEATRKEQESRQANYAGLQGKQPARSMDYSPTREGLNKWMETWEEPGKIAYVYLVNAQGQETGYYVFEGLPVSYCASLTPPDTKIDDVDGDVVMRAPSMDGVYYSGSQCLQYFGFDATTGSYIEFSIGGSQNFFVTEEPLPRPDVEPLGFTTIEEAKGQ